MLDTFLFKKFLTVLILPPAGPLLGALVGLAFMRRRVGKLLLTASVSALLICSMPWAAHGLSVLVYDGPPFDEARAKEAGAIVILGGGLRDAPEFGGDAPSRWTLERVRYGAYLAKRTGLPVLVTGGSVYGGPAEAPVMRKVLEEEYGVAVRWVEDGSRNTHENALKSAELLKRDGVARVVLVTHALHMPRSSAEFEAAGIETIPAATLLPDHSAEDVPWFFRWMPNMAALYQTHYALYELLGLAARRIGL